MPTLIKGVLYARRRTHPLVALLVVLAVFGAAMLVGRALARWANLGTAAKLSLDDAWRQTVFLLIVVAVLFGLLALWLRRAEGRPLWTVGFFGGGIGRKVLRGFLFGTALNLVPFGIAVAAGWVRITGRATDLVAPTIIAALVIMLPGWLAQASSEEALFRGFLMPSMAVRWGVPAAVTIQSLLFGVSHFSAYSSDPDMAVGPGIAAAVVIGLVLAKYALYEGGLWGVCAFHGAFNWCNSVQTVWSTEASGATRVWLLIIPPLLAALVLAYLLRRNGAADREPTPPGLSGARGRAVPAH